MKYLIFFSFILLFGCDFFQLDDGKLRCYKNADCPKAQRCETDLNRCITTCKNNQDCPNLFKCDLASQTCQPACQDISCGDQGVCAFDTTLKKEFCNCFDNYQDNNNNLICTPACPEIIPENHSICDDSQDIIAWSCEEGYQNNDNNPLHICKETCETACDLSIQSCDDQEGFSTCNFISYKLNAPENGSISGKMIKRDHNGNIYIMGEMKGDIDLNPLSGESRKTAPQLGIYLTKFSPNYRYLWSILLQGDDQLTPGGFTIDDDENCYLTGTFQGTLSLPSGNTLESPEKQRLFLLKFSPDGSLPLGTIFTLGSDTTETYGSGIDIDSKNNIYLAGWYKHDPPSDNTDPTINLNFTGKGEPSIHTTTASDHSAPFVIKMNQDLKFQWDYQITKSGGLYPIISRFDPENDTEKYYMIANPKQMNIRIKNDLINISIHYAPHEIEEEIEKMINYGSTDQEKFYYSKNSPTIDPMIEFQNIFIMFQINPNGQANYASYLPMRTNQDLPLLESLQGGKSYLVGSVNGQNVNINSLSQVWISSIYYMRINSGIVEDPEPTTDLFVAVYDLISLEFLHYIQIKNDRNITVTQVYVNTDQQLFIAGSYSAPTKFDGVSTTDMKQNNRDGFLLKLDMKTDLKCDLNNKETCLIVPPLKDLNLLQGDDVVINDFIVTDDTLFALGNYHALENSNFTSIDQTYQTAGDSDTIIIKLDIK